MKARGRALGLGEVQDWRVIWVSPKGLPVCGNWLDIHEALPDLTDAATVGALATVVREATGKPHLFCGYRHDGLWSVCDLDEHLSGFYPREADAWIETLEDAHE